MSVRIGDVTIRIGASTNQLQADLRRAERSLQNSAQRFNAIGQGLTISLTAPLIGLGAAATTSFAEIERLQNSLTAVMGDAKTAGEEFERLRKVAEAPGLALPQVVSASAKLQAVGLSAEEARDTISQYGNAVARSGGQAQEFDGAILALTQIASKGKISAEELNQLGERIFEIRPALEAAFGTSNSEELQKLGISAEEFIAKTTTELGKLERVQGGLSNAFENFRDNITSALSTLGDSISSAIDLPSLLDRISGAVAKVGEFFRNLSPEAQKAIVYFGLFAAAIGPLLIIFSKLSLAIGSIRIAMVGLQVAFTQGGLLAAFSFLGGPAIAGIAALAAAVYLLYKNWETVKTALIDVINYFIDLYNESVIFRGAINYIILGFKQIYQAGKLAVNLIINGFKLAFKFLIDNFANVGKIAKAVLTLDFKSIPGIIADAYKNGFDNVKEFIGDSANDFNEFGKNTGENIINGLNNTLRDNKIKKITLDDIFSKDINETNIGDTKVKKEFEDTPKIDPELAKELAKIQAELANVDKLFKAGLITPAEQAQQKIKLLEDRLKLLVINGFKPQSKAVLDTKNQIQGLKDGQEAIIKPIQAFLQLINVIPGKLNPVAQQATALQLSFYELENAVTNGLITPFEASQQKIDLLNNELKRLSDEGLKPTSKEIQNVRDQLNELGVISFGDIKDLSDPIAELSDETLTELNKQITIIQEKTAAGLISQSDADVERINAIKTALNTLIEQGLGGTDAAAKLQEQLKGAESSVKTTYTNIFDFLGNKIASLPGIAEKLGENVQTLGPKIGKAFEGAVAAVQQVFSTFGAFFDMQEAKIDQFEEKEKERIANSIMGEEAKEAALANLNEKVLKKRKALARKQAALDKASALFSATIAGANAVLQALAVPLIGPVLAKITAGLVAAQLAFIAATPLPSLAIGTDLVKSDGLAMLHKGEAVVPADVAKGGFNGSGGMAQVSGRIQGTDIILVSDYAMNFKNRIR